MRYLTFTFPFCLAMIPRSFHRASLIHKSIARSQSIATNSLRSCNSFCLRRTVMSGKDQPTDEGSDSSPAEKESNKRAKLEAADGSKPSALDEQQLKAIGYDRDKLKDFKQRTGEEVKEVGASDLAKRDKDAKMVGAVEQAEDDRNDDLMTNDSSTEKPSIIQVQKSRAKQQLAGKHHPTMHAIHAALDKGCVKPLFHTHFLPETFLGNPRSLSDVTAGEVDKDRQLEFDFYANNLAEAVVVDKNGNARGADTIIDDAIGKSEWDFSHKLTAFAVELVNTDAEMLGEDIECTKLTSIPISVNPESDSCDLLTRPESRGVVHDIFHRFEDEFGSGGSVATITGSEGIGKSWTLLYALQQALLYDGATVLFFFQKMGNAVLYLRRNNKMYAWMSSPHDTANSCLFKRSDVLVLLDPKEVRQRGANFATGMMKLMYVAYNNEAYISSAAEKSNGQMQAYLGPPLDSELRVILKRLKPSLTQDVIEERKKNIGNLITYLLHNHVYNIRCKDTELRQALLDEGMSHGRETVSGTVLQVCPTRSDEIGYDGQGIEYRKRSVLVANNNLRNAIVKAGREMLLLYWGKVTGDEYSRIGREAAKLFIKDLTNPDGMVMKRYLQGSAAESELVVGSGMVVQKDSMMMSKICAAVLTKTNVVAKVAKGCELINAAGPGRRVYHVTVSASHTMALADMESLCKSTGYIDEDGNVLPEGEVDKLEFYWVVPTGLGATWTKKAPHKYQEGYGNKMNEVLERHVNQYVLPMTYKKPLTFSQWKEQSDHVTCD